MIIVILCPSVDQNQIMYASIRAILAFASSEKFIKGTNPAKVTNSLPLVLTSFRRCWIAVTLGDITSLPKFAFSDSCCWYKHSIAFVMT